MKNTPTNSSQHICQHLKIVFGNESIQRSQKIKSQKMKNERVFTITQRVKI